MENSLFILEGRMSRKKYGTYIIALLVGFIIMNFFFDLIINLTATFNNDTLGILLFAGRFTLKVLLNILIILSSYKRVQDISISGILAVVCGIPYIQIPAILTLLLIKGTEGDNKYGTVPLKIKNKNRSEVAIDVFER
ncbi:DUF805 domain-containing protein [Clostridium tunisiense]|uniref:DUF805 domain-containing protein n=1 Tax=Clostridium tunisiense TaxID=219748 RepID=UPI0003004C1E|nr:DUF805 domain-containing protein [Clostridium tunisiense]